MNNDIKYFLYARKSTESDEKQVQSLGDQIKVMKDKARLLGITIIDVFEESRSAKAPGRNKFNEMISRISNGEAKGVIAWKLDRLTRNPVDSGTIQYMLQNGALTQVITNDREYNPVDAGLLMSVENGMSNQFIIDLRKNVKRGLDSKTEKGGFCGQAPEGYRNDKETRTIKPDTDNFILIQKAWKLMASGNYTVPQLLKLINNKWGYMRKKKNGGKQLSESGLYALFKNPFYTGNFLRKGDIKKGIHKAMITWGDYHRVQQVLGKKGSAIRPQAKEFAYTGMMKCGECGSSITAEEKKKYIKEKGEVKIYTYYRCTKRKKGCSCKQKTTSLSNLEKQIEEILNNIEVLPVFKSWGLKIVQEDFKQMREEQDKIVLGLEKNIKTSERALVKLLDYLMEEIIDKDEYNKRKDETKKKLEAYKVQLAEMQTGKDESIEQTEELIDTIVEITTQFNSGTLREKKRIFSLLGENFELTDGVLAGSLYPWVNVINKQLPEIKRQYRRLEPIKKGSAMVITEPSSELISLWYTRQGSNPR